MIKVLLFGILIGVALSGIVFFAMLPAIDTVRFGNMDVEACNGLAHQLNEMRVGIPMQNLTHRVNAGELMFKCSCSSDGDDVSYLDVVASQNGSRVISSEIFCTPIWRE